MGEVRNKAGREKTNKHRILSGNPERKCQFKDLGAEVRLTIGWDLKDVNWIRLAHEGSGGVGDLMNTAINFQFPKEFREFPDQLNNYQLLYQTFDDNTQEWVQSGSLGTTT
jgi:hypothetical protein